jgi:O-antigen ligase
MVLAALLLCIVIVRVPAIFGDDAPTWAYALPVVVFGSLSALLAANRPALRARFIHLVLLGLYVGLTCLSFLRAALAGTLLDMRGAVLQALVVGLLAVFCVLALLGVADERVRRRRYLAVAAAPALYVAINVVLHFADIRPPADVGTADLAGQPAQLLGLAGIAFGRIQFPLAAGVNNFGAVAGLGLVMSALLATQLRGPARWLACAGAAATLYALVVVDSRGGLLFAAAAIAILRWLPRALERGVSGLPLLVPIAPAAILGVLGVLSGTTLADVLSRDVGDFSTATGRGEVWSKVASFLADPQLHHLWGYGAYGQITSEVSYSYAYVFYGYPRPETPPAHNFVLQTILESGYIGLALALAVLVAAIRGASRAHVLRPGPETGALLAGLLFLIGLGTIEAVPLPSYPDAYAGFLAITIAALRVTPAGVPRGRSAPGAGHAAVRA